MILTVTLNPAVDKTLHGEQLINGQVNRMKASSNFAGGKGINVTKILRQYGREVTATGFIGGYAGRFIQDSVRQLGAADGFVSIEQETRTNINVITGDGYVTEILEPGPSITQKEYDRFMGKYIELAAESDLIVLSGSVANGLPLDIYQNLVERGNKMGKRVLLDTSGMALVHGIQGMPFMIKPNKKELEFVCRQRLTTNAEVAAAANALRKKGIGQVVVSLGRQGIIYADGECTMQIMPPMLRTMNTVGCGDSVVASLAMSYEAGEDKETALKKAVAVSAANATTMGSGEIPKELAEEILNDVTIRKNL